MQAITTIGVDIAKSVFQVHCVDAQGNVVLRRQLKRRHDAGADHRREKKGRPEPLAEYAFGKRRHQLSSLALAIAPSIRPISLSRCCRLSWSRLLIGSAVKIAMR